MWPGEIHFSCLGQEKKSVKKERKKNLPSALKGDTVSVFQGCLLYKRLEQNINATWQDLNKYKRHEELSPY